MATILSLYPGCGSHLSGYENSEVRLALEPRNDARAALERNLHIPTQSADATKFYNRKQKGVADLLELLRIRDIGDLDILDITTDLEVPEDKHRALNLFDVFGIARRLKPKIVVAFAPLSVAENKNRQRFHSFLDYLRYDNLKNREKREYFVAFTTIDAGDWGAAVRTKRTLVIGVRCDVAAANHFASDQAILALLPKVVAPAKLGEMLGETSPAERDHWFLETAKNLPLKKAIAELPLSPDMASIMIPTNRQKSDFGFKKSQDVRIARASLNDALPDPTAYQTIHPDQARLLTNSELQSALGLPHAWRSPVSDRALLERAIPPVVVKQLLAQTLQPLLDGKVIVPKANSAKFEKIAFAETLRVEGDIPTYHTSIDIGFEASRDREGAEPTEDDFDFLFDANEINRDFIVYGPYDPEIGRRPVLGAVKRKVFQGKDRRDLIRMIDRAVEKGNWSEQRVKESVIPVSVERIERYKKNNVKFELSKDGLSFRKWVAAKKKRPAHWDGWRSEPMPSISYGWGWVRKEITFKDKDSKDAKRHIKEVALSPDLRDNPSVAEKWNAFSSRVTGIYRKLSFDDFVKQAKFMRSWVPKKYHLGGGLFTTMSIQKYGDEMSAMGFHIDSGDDNSGLTAITVVDEGTYEGGYFVLPRYRVAFRVGDGDVFVANSRQVHGVSALEGSGKRLSVVSYSKTAIGRRARMNAYPIKSPRPKFRIDKYQIAIPSFKRDDKLVKATLAVLESYSIDPKRVTIFMANEDERQRYAKALANSPYQNLVIAQEGIKEVRNFMWNYYPEGTPVLFMDDDVEEVQIINPRNSKERIRAPDLFNDVIAPGFNAMRENHAYIWGMYAASNPGFMVGIDFDEDREDGDEENSSAITIGNVYIIGSFFGAVIRHDPKLLVGCADKEDHERSVTHFIKDGRVVRLDFVTVKSDYGTQSTSENHAKGGLQETRTHETVKDGADYMLQNYPKYVRIRQRRTTGYWEVKHI